MKKLKKWNLSLVIQAKNIILLIIVICLQSYFNNEITKIITATFLICLWTDLIPIHIIEFHNRKVEMQEEFEKVCERIQELFKKENLIKKKM